MRIAVFDFATGQQTTNFDQFFDHCFVCIPFAALAVQDIFAPKKWQISTEGSIIHHVIGDDLFQHTQITVQFIFLHPVGWGAMHEPCAFGVGHEISCAEIANVVPFAVRSIRTI